jgi:hypothetical protein
MAKDNLEARPCSQRTLYIFTRHKSNDAVLFPMDGILTNVFFVVTAQIYYK